jgi:hypothetical protein
MIINRLRDKRVLVPLFTAFILIILDVLLVIGPGGGDWSIFWVLIGGPISFFSFSFNEYSELSKLIIIIEIPLNLLGILAYSIRPRTWTLCITLLSLIFWWITGQSVAFIGV